MHTLMWSQPGGLVVPWLRQRATVRGGRGQCPRSPDTLRMSLHSKLLQELHLPAFSQWA